MKDEFAEQRRLFELWYIAQFKKHNNTLDLARNTENHVYENDFIGAMFIGFCAGMEMSNGE